jgi:hypothetical protein
MNIRDFFHFERPLQRHRVVVPAPEEQAVLHTSAYVSIRQHTRTHTHTHTHTD